MRSVFNKIGICQLMMQRYKEAKKNFEHAIQADRNTPTPITISASLTTRTHNYNAAIRHL